MAFKQTFTSVTELESSMYNLLREAQQATLEEMEDELYKFIERYVYNFPEGSFYNRTEDLYYIWEITKPYVKDGIVRGSIKPSNYSQLQHISEEWVHSSPIGRELNTYDYVNLINNGVKEENSTFGEIPARPFWDDFLMWANKNYSSIFAKHCKKLGIPIKGGASGFSNVGSIINR